MFPCIQCPPLEPHAQGLPGKEFVWPMSAGERRPFWTRHSGSGGGGLKMGQGNSRGWQRLTDLLLPTPGRRGEEFLLHRQHLLLAAAGRVLLQQGCVEVQEGPSPRELVQECGRPLGEAWGGRDGTGVRRLSCRASLRPPPQSRGGARRSPAMARAAAQASAQESLQGRP